jgi:hypothetical protein
MRKNRNPGRRFAILVVVMVLCTAGAIFLKEKCELG